MFDKKTVDAYRSVKAPDSLRERVLGADFTGKKKRTLFSDMRILSAAAALALVITATLVLAGTGVLNPVSVSMDGREIGRTPSAAVFGTTVSAASPRVFSLDEYPVLFEFALNGKATVSVTEGEIVLHGNDAGDELERGTEITLEGSGYVSWVTDTILSNRAEMRVTQGTRTRVYVLEKGLSGEWTIFRE